jgi:CheY-like chemotaxis protein
LGFAPILRGVSSVGFNGGLSSEALNSMFSSTLMFGSRDKPLSVVVVDDVVEICVLVRHWLSDVGCAVTSTASGNELAKLMRSKAFDLIITDVIMPDGDGLEVILEAKRVQPAARLLAISGGGSHLQAVDCLRFAKGLGAHAVLLKPFNREQLLDAVSKITLAPGAPAQQPPAGGNAGA